MHFRAGAFARVFRLPASNIRDCAVATGGRLSIDSVARELGASVRMLEPSFREHVGLPPKLFARVARFWVAWWALRAGRPGAEVAALAGYSDQPHLVREFRALAGVSPTRI